MKRTLLSRLGDVSRVSKYRQGNFNELLFSPLLNGWIATRDCAVRNVDTGFASAPDGFAGVGKLRFSRLFIGEEFGSSRVILDDCKGFWGFGKVFIFLYPFIFASLHRTRFDICLSCIKDNWFWIASTLYRKLVGHYIPVTKLSY